VSVDVEVDGDCHVDLDEPTMPVAVIMRANSARIVSRVSGPYYDGTTRRRHPAPDGADGAGPGVG